MPEPQTLLTGLVFGKSPRWHDNRLWFSDMGAHEVGAVGLDGSSEVIARVPGMPMGIGWLPDGRMLIVSARDGRLLRREPDGSLVTHADLTSLATHPWSDMVVDGRGNAYIGNIGFDFPAGEFATGIVVLVTPEGSARQVADGVAFANGMVVTPDNATLILAESYANRLTAFDIAADGGLSNRRVWADGGRVLRCGQHGGRRATDGPGAHRPGTRAGRRLAVGPAQGAQACARQRSRRAQPARTFLVAQVRAR